MRPVHIIFSAMVLSLVISAVPARAAAGDGTPEKPTAVDSERAGERGLAAKMWWNQPKKVSELELSTSQRAAMDKSLERFLENRRGLIRAQRAAFAAFGEALASDDAVAIAARGESLKSAMAAPLEAQVTLMTEVSMLLEPEQRLRLRQRYPKLLSRQWIRSGRGLGPRG